MNPRPEVPSDLSGLSLDQLNALIEALAAWAAANSAGEATDAAIAEMTAAAADHSRLAARVTELAAAEPEPALPSLAELAAGITPPAAPATPEPAAANPTVPAVPAAPAPTSGFSIEQLTAAVTAAVQAALPVPTLLEEATGIVASGDGPLPALSSLRRAQPVPDGPEPIRPVTAITASADIPGFPLGQELADFDALGRAFIARREQIGQVPEGSPSEKIIVARVASGLPDERVLHVGQDADNTRKIAEASPTLNGLTASGGSCVPVQPYYGLLVQSGAHRPVRDMLLGFGVNATRGGVSVLQPPTITSPGSVSRVVTDGATTNASTTVTSATAAFVPPGWGGVGGDLGAPISGTGIPAGAFIAQVVNATTVVISAPATATATGVTVTIVRQGAVGVVTNAADLAALGGTTAQGVAGLKPCLHVTCPAPTTVQVDAISYCLEFGNFTTRAFPEQMPAWLQLTLAVWARTAETRLLDRMSALSTQITATGIVGAARSLITQIIKAAAYFRNRNRLTDEVTLRVALPRWVLDLAACDLIHGSGYETEFYSMARAQFAAALGEANVTASYYVDSANGKGQLFAPGGVQGAVHGATALVAFPSTVVWYMFPEGSFLFLDGGFLDFGMWRDSGLNAANNYRLMAETFEALAPTGYEMLEVTSTVVANGTFAGPAYGSSTQSSPVAIPSSV